MYLYKKGGQGDMPHFREINYIQARVAAEHPQPFLMNRNMFKN